jgi:triosephosphate isomerase (TIM)
MLAGNWKMHNTVGESIALAQSIMEGSQGVTDGDIVIAPVFTALAKVGDVIRDSQVALAAQDVFSEEKGAYTGEIAPSMLKDAGCAYAIIGHSERRKYFGETDDTVNAKMKKSLAAGLKPIMCVGETEEEREKGVTEYVIGMQVIKGLYGFNSLDDITVAYEPVWAIGTGKTATPEQAEAVHAFIRGILKDKFGSAGADSTRILYGGSVTPDNVSQLMEKNNVDGALIGGASLKSESFLSIIRAVSGR